MHVLYPSREIAEAIAKRLESKSGSPHSVETAPGGFYVLKPGEPKAEPIPAVPQAIPLPKPAKPILHAKPVPSADWAPHISSAEIVKQAKEFLPKKSLFNEIATFVKEKAPSEFCITFDVWKSLNGKEQNALAAFGKSEGYAVAVDAPTESVIFKSLAPNSEGLTVITWEYINPLDLGVPAAVPFHIPTEEWSSWMVTLPLYVFRIKYETPKYVVAEHIGVPKPVYLPKTPAAKLWKENGLVLCQFVPKVSSKSASGKMIEPYMVAITSIDKT